MTGQPTTELNPPTDTLATTDTDGWIEEGGSIGEEVKIIEQRLLTPVIIACKIVYTVEEGDGNENTTTKTSIKINDNIEPVVRN